jgi:hypothetical protein
MQERLHPVLRPFLSVPTIRLPAPRLRRSPGLATPRHQTRRRVRTGAEAAPWEDVCLSVLVLWRLLELEVEDAIWAASERSGYDPKAVERAFHAKFWRAGPERREREPALHPTRELDRSIPQLVVTSSGWSGQRTRRRCCGKYTISLRRHSPRSHTQVF